MYQPNHETIGICARHTFGALCAGAGGSVAAFLPCGLVYMAAFVDDSPVSGVTGLVGYIAGAVGGFIGGVALWLLSLRTKPRAFIGEQARRQIAMALLALSVSVIAAPMVYFAWCLR